MHARPAIVQIILLVFPSLLIPIAGLIFGAGIVSKVMRYVVTVVLIPLLLILSC